jgi:hypothetical protein
VRRPGPPTLRLAAGAAPLAASRLPQHELLGIFGIRASPWRSGRGCLADLHADLDSHRWIFSQLISPFVFETVPCL